MALTPYTGTFGTAELRHLLRRTLFGASNADLSAFGGQSLTQVVSALLTASTSAPAPPLNAYQSATTVDPDCGLGATWVNGTTINDNLPNGLTYERFQSLRKWWLGNMINQPRTIEQKMIFFWYNHMPHIFQGGVDDPIYSYRYFEMLRQRALGNFKDMVRDSALSPLMLQFLDGQWNNKWSPNENYGRELQELFTIGKDSAVSYTEDDVAKAALTLTGWRINYTTRQTYFDLTWHDTTNKTFSSFYNNTVITGQNNVTGGLTELNALLDMIFVNNETANYVVRKLYRFLVYHKIDASTETNVIQPLATTFRNSGYNIKTLLTELLTSQHFFDVQSKGCYVKSPLDFTVGFIRTFGVNTYNSDLVNQYKNWSYFVDRAAETDLSLGYVPNVAGYPPYYQSPAFHDLWAIPENLRDRHNFINKMVSSNYNGMFFDVLAFTSTIPGASDPNTLIAYVLDMAHTIPCDQAVKDQLKANLISNMGDTFWTTAWNNYSANTSNTTNANTVKTRLKNLYNAVFTMAEAHLC